MSEFSLLPCQDFVTPGQNGNISVFAVTVGYRLRSPPISYLAGANETSSVFDPERVFAHGGKVKLRGGLSVVQENFLR